METQKLSYYQRNKEKILEKRKFQREERLRLGRPFMKFDDESELTFEPKVEPILNQLMKILWKMLLYQ